MHRFLLALMFPALTVRAASFAETGPVPRSPEPVDGTRVVNAAPAAPLKIMPLGDSITFGWVDVNYGGYRRLLGTLLTADGYDFSFVGSQKSGVGVLPDPDNEGHPGWTIPQLKNGIDSAGWLETYRPDLILLHIGTNDLHKGLGSEAAANLSALLDDILQRLPQARVIVAQIITVKTGPTKDHQAYDAAIPEIAASKGARVSVVDMSRLLVPADYADTLHPNATGYDKMAHAWETAILQLAAVEQGSSAAPNVCALEQNYPNPFSLRSGSSGGGTASTSIAYSVAGKGPVRLRIYDALGKLVRTLVDGEMSPGDHSVSWTGRDEEGAPVPSGLYLVRLEAGARDAVRKLVLLR